MKILMAANISNSRLTGMGRHMHFIGDELRRMGHEVVYIFEDDVAKVLPGRQLSRVNYPWLLLGAIHNLQKQNGKFDIVNIHEPSGAAYCFCKKIFRNLPTCVITSHGVEERGWEIQKQEAKVSGMEVSLRSRISWPITELTQARFALKNCEHVLCLSTDDEEFLQERYGIAKSKITRIANGTSEGFFVEKVTNEVPRLLFVGTWMYRKGTKYLATSYADVWKKHPDVELSLLGTFSDESTVLRDFPPEVRQNIRVVPKLSEQELIGEYRRHDIFILPSLYEGMPLVLLEAMAAGLAVITTSTCGMRHVIEHRRDGLLIPVRDDSSLTDSILTLISDSELRAELSHNARAKARKYSWENVARKIEDVYKTLVEKQGMQSESIAHQ